MPRSRRPRIGCWIFLALLIVAGLLGWREYKRMVREHPERFPWTELSLGDPIGPFTGIKLAALTDDARQCRALLQSAELAEVSVAPPDTAERRCRLNDGVRIRPEREESVEYAPAGLDRKSVV